MKIVISAESTIDLPEEMLQENDIHTIPFGIEFGGELRQDRFGISSEIFEFVEESKKLPKTSAIAPEQYREYFEELKKDYDAVIHISLSSQMSCAYNNARLIAEDMENVFVIDSKTLSTGIALVALFANELVGRGLDVSEIVQLVEEKTNHIQASFVIEKLNFLHKGGRCSALTLLGANILKIKPEIVVQKGKMVVGKKYIGNMRKVVEKYVDDLLIEYQNPDKSIAFITHSSPMPEIQEMIKEKLVAGGFEKVVDTFAGGTISSHCGPNCIGVLFVNK